MLMRLKRCYLGADLSLIVSKFETNLLQALRLSTYAHFTMIDASTTIFVRAVYKIHITAKTPTSSAILSLATSTNEARQRITILYQQQSWHELPPTGHMRMTPSPASKFSLLFTDTTQQTPRESHHAYALYLTKSHASDTQADCVAFIHNYNTTCSPTIASYCTDTNRSVRARTRLHLNVTFRLPVYSSSAGDKCIWSGCI